MIGLDISHVVNGQEVGTAVPQLTWFLITWCFILVLKNSYNVILVHNRITLWKFFETENSLLTNFYQLLKTMAQNVISATWCFKKITITLAVGLLYDFVYLFKYCLTKMAARNGQIANFFPILPVVVLQFFKKKIIPGSDLG